MTDQFTDAAEEAVEELVPARGVYIPKWVIVSVIAPVILGGASATWFITDKLSLQVQSNTVQKERLIQIDQKLDSHKELLLQILGSHEKRIDRIENRIYGNQE